MVVVGEGGDGVVVDVVVVVLVVVVEEERLRCENAVKGDEMELSVEASEVDEGPLKGSGEGGASGDDGEVAERDSGASNDSGDGVREKSFMVGVSVLGTGAGCKKEKEERSKRQRAKKQRSKREAEKGGEGGEWDLN